MEWLCHKQTEPTVILEDNEACWSIMESELATKRSRFVDTRFFYSREKQIEGEVDIRRCPTRLMRADVLTKALGSALLREHWDVIRGEGVLELE